MKLHMKVLTYKWEVFEIMNPDAGMDVETILRPITLIEGAEEGSVRLALDASFGRFLRVKLTLTNPGCTASDYDDIDLLDDKGFDFYPDFESGESGFDMDELMEEMNEEMEEQGGEIVGAAPGGGLTESRGDEFGGENRGGEITNRGLTIDSPSDFEVQQPIGAINEPSSMNNLDIYPEQTTFPISIDQELNLDSIDPPVVEDAAVDNKSKEEIKEPASANHQLDDLKQIEDIQLEISAPSTQPKIDNNQRSNVPTEEELDALVNEILLEEEEEIGNKKEVVSSTIDVVAQYASEPEPEVAQYITSEEEERQEVEITKSVEKKRKTSKARPLTTYLNQRYESQRLLLTEMKTDKRLTKYASFKHAESLLFPENLDFKEFNEKYRRNANLIITTLKRKGGIEDEKLVRLLSVITAHFLDKQLENDSQNIPEKTFKVINDVMDKLPEAGIPMAELIETWNPKELQAETTDALAINKYLNLLNGK